VLIDISGIGGVTRQWLFQAPEMLQERIRCSRASRHVSKTISGPLGKFCLL
jgi:hypothetical protein